MTATTVKSVNVTNIEASPLVGLDRKRGRLKILHDQDAIATTSLDEVGDLMLFGPIPSNAVILDVLHLNDDLDSGGTGLDINAGLYYSGIGGTQTKDGNTSGTVIDADCFASDSDAFTAAVTVWTSLRFEADDIVDVGKEAWDVAGLSADPGGLFYVGLAVGTNVATTEQAGDIVLRVDYI